MNYVEMIMVYVTNGFGTPKFSTTFTDGQIVVVIIGSWIVLTTQVSMIIYFWSAWIKGAYANSGTGSKEKDSKFELHEVRELKKDVFQYLDKIVFYAMTFTIPLLDAGQLYPVIIVAMLGTGAFGKTVLEIIEKAKGIFVSDKKTQGLAIDLKE